MFLRREQVAESVQTLRVASGLGLAGPVTQRSAVTSAGAIRRGLATVFWNGRFRDPYALKSKKRSGGLPRLQADRTGESRCEFVAVNVPVRAGYGALRVRRGSSESTP